MNLQSEEFQGEVVGGGGGGHQLRGVDKLLSEQLTDCAAVYMLCHLLACCKNTFVHLCHQFDCLQRIYPTRSQTPDETASPIHVLCHFVMRYYYRCQILRRKTNDHLFK